MFKRSTSKRIAKAAAKAGAKFAIYSAAAPVLGAIGLTKAMAETVTAVSVAVKSVIAGERPTSDEAIDLIINVIDSIS